jgi:hypothetical protein
VNVIDYLFHRDEIAAARKIERTEAKIDPLEPYAEIKGVAGFKYRVTVYTPNLEKEDKWWREDYVKYDWTTTRFKSRAERLSKRWLAEAKASFEHKKYNKTIR